MSNLYLFCYTLIAILLSALDLFIAFRAFRKKEKIGRYLGYSALFSGAITLSYLIGIRASGYRVMSFFTSVYFAGIDCMLVSLMHFVVFYTEMQSSRQVMLARNGIRIWAAFDVLVMLFNFVEEIAVEYVPQEGMIVAYGYSMKPLYILHLVFTYVTVVMIVALLFYKRAKTPRRYSGQYGLIIQAIAVVVAVNAAFLFMDKDLAITQLDYSVFGYSLGLLIMYWGAFVFRSNSMSRALSLAAVQDIDQGMALFDYTGKLTMGNRMAEQLFPDVEFTAGMSMEDFLSACEIPELDQTADRYGVPCKRNGLSGRPLRCDYNRLKDAHGNVIGYVFTFVDNTSDTDLLTGFQRWAEFRQNAIQDPDQFPAPASAVVFDIAGLGEINRTYSVEAGDEHIRALAGLIRKSMPADASLIRGYEAHLVAVCPQCTEQELSERVEEVIAGSDDTVFYGISSTIPGIEETGKRLSINEVIETASRSLHAKKLLSSQSTHSQTIASLVRALQECDPDTEEHVQRTQKMGAMLGSRIGLNDVQQVELSLLCLLHDIGKIGVPLEILNKPGRLTEEEFSVLRTHTEKGYQIALSSGELKPIAEMILYHHERWDGEGYPKKLSGTEIPLLSRIISIVDSYDAMVNDRSYRKAISPALAQEEIRQCSGTQFDPVLAEEFLRMLQEDPALAKGEKTSETEQIQIFLPDIAPEEASGNTIIVPYSRYLLDFDNVIIEVDERFEEITGYSAEDVIGKLTQLDLIPPEDRGYYLMQVISALSKSSIAYLKHELLRKDGTKCWVVCCGKQYYDSAEKAVRNEILIFHTTGGPDET